MLIGADALDLDERHRRSSSSFMVVKRCRRSSLAWRPIAVIPTAPVPANQPIRMALATPSVHPKYGRATYAPAAA